MRMLTFNGFLRQYVKELSRADTLNMKRLAKDAESGEYRLQAPLVLYAVVSGKKLLLSDSLSKSDGAVEMRQMLAHFSSVSVEQTLQLRNAPEEYLKVWAAYQVAKNAPDRDNALKAVIRSKVLQFQSEKHCSNYRIYTDLKLNPGNVNCWLKHGDQSKVSYQTAKQIMDYLMSY